MKTIKLRKELTSTDISTFKNGLISLIFELKIEKNKLSSLKQIYNIFNSYLDTAIFNTISNNDIIESENYRIASERYALQIIPYIFLQQNLDEAELKIKHLKYLKSYSSLKKQEKTPEYTMPKKFINFLELYIDILNSYSENNKPQKLNGYQNISELKDILNTSNIDVFFNNMDNYIKEENSLRKTLKSKDFNIIDELSHTYNNSICLSDTLDDNLIKKTTIVHIPKYNKLFPTTCLFMCNVILVSEFTEFEDKNIRFLSEFATTLLDKLNVGIMNDFEIPIALNNRFFDISFTQKKEIFYDLISYGLVKNTKLELEHRTANELKELDLIDNFNSDLSLLNTLFK